MKDNPSSDPASHPAASNVRGSLRLPMAIVFLFVAVGAVVFGIRSLSAAGSASISVSPASKVQVWYKPTPITITINSSAFSGPGQTPISGYQYGLTWNPAVLQWLSGPNVGPGTPTPSPILPCGQQIITWGTATATPPGFIPTYTPTATNTPGAGTPTNTPTTFPSPTMTPTPGGYVLVACATISNATPVPNGVIGTFKFLPLVTGASSTSLGLIQVKVVDHNGATVVPMVTPVPGVVSFVNCHDVNGDGRVNLLDLSAVASHFGTKLGDPNYSAASDVNNDGKVNLLDLSTVAAAFNLTC